MRSNSPTALLPTMAIFLCLGGAILLLLVFWGGRKEVERVAGFGRYEVWPSQSNAATSLPKMRLVGRTCRLISWMS